jgi:ribonucleotide reductase beta subunit family protein with ferritin-like domain
MSNEFIARDEGMHTNFGCLLYSKIKNKLDAKIVYEMIDEALTIEKEFINQSLPCRLIGMNSMLMNQYIEFVCDRLLVQLGYPKVYKQTNPFPFMDNISVEGKTNFFEHRVTQYQKADISTSNSNFDLTDDF